jgi:hypothetical protein
MVLSFWKIAWKFLERLNLELPQDLAIPLVGMYGREQKPCVHRKLCTQIFITASFIIINRYATWGLPTQ